MFAAVENGRARLYQELKEEVLRGTEDALKVVGYQLLVSNYIGFVRPDFHGRRNEGDVTYEMWGW